MNFSKKVIFPQTKRYIVQFLNREWINILRGAFAGATSVILFNIAKAYFIRVHPKITNLTTYLKRVGLSDSKLYRTALMIALSALSIAVCSWAFRILWKALKSWSQGVLSGVTLTTGLSCFFFGAFVPYSNDIYNIIAAICASTAFLLVSLLFLLRAKLRYAKPHPFKFSPPSARSLSTELLPVFHPDTPVENWDGDLLNRAPLVEAIATHILISQVPVVALHGTFGEGKSSLLNLLRQTIAPYSIVVTFSTWLPGTEATLATDLFNDVAAECRKRFIIPQFRKRLLGYARTMSGNIPYLKLVSDLLPQTTQRNDIEELRDAFERIPQRVVILLDELDRMHADELRILLKLIRGVANFPNLTYVCAFKRESIAHILFSHSNDETNEYFEKFFPLTIELPKQDAAILNRLFTKRLVHIFETLKCFDQIVSRENFSKEIDRVWDDCLMHLCTNLRKLGSLLNDVESAARPISQEVHPLDLTLIETVRRFFPALYDQIWMHPSHFVGTGNSRKGRYRSDEQTQNERNEFFKSFEDSKITGDLSGVLRLILEWLFPNFSDYLKHRASWYLRNHASRDIDKAADERRIHHPDFFPIYFRYHVPESLFSAVTLQTFFAKMNEATSEDERTDLFRSVLQSTIKGSPRRYDLLYRLVRLMSNLNDSAAEALAYAVSRHAHDYVYEILNMGESGRAIAATFQALQRFEKSDRIQFTLSKCIGLATDDTFAFQLLSFSTASREQNRIITDFDHINTEGLKVAFCNRMRTRYGPTVNAQQTTLIEADQQAFNFWARYSDQERQMEIDFWTRFIGNSRKRLAQAVNFIFPPNTVWEEDPTPAVDVYFPIDRLRNLLDTLVPDNLDEIEERGLQRLSTLLEGQFRTP